MTMAAGKRPKGEARRAQALSRAREVHMSPARKDSPLFSWNPFAAWDTSQEVETDSGERSGSESLETTLPASVETEEEDGAMGPEGFTPWF